MQKVPPKTAMCVLPYQNTHNHVFIIPRSIHHISGFLELGIMSAWRHACIYTAWRWYLSMGELMLFRSNIRVDYSIQKLKKRMKWVEEDISPSAPRCCNGITSIGFVGNYVCYVIPRYPARREHVRFDRRWRSAHLMLRSIVACMENNIWKSTYMIQY
jgi:hypothetical protein